MKIRNGFVSNSSSSSFIVALPKKPKNIEEMRQLLFGNDKETPLFAPFDDATFSQQQVAETVFADLKTAIKENKVAEEISHGYFEGYPQHDYSWRKDETDDDRQKRWQEETKKVTSAAQKLADKFIADNKGKKFFVFSYSDNDGDYSAALEHGDTFRLLPHLVISHH